MMKRYKTCMYIKRDFEVNIAYGLSCRNKSVTEGLFEKPILCPRHAAGVSFPSIGGLGC